ncbi:MAG: ATP-binding protein [Erysipelotrichaceae bacterium]|nr:ATP-binding protein [Erysipelotrichaceae bacterium]
MKRDVEKILLKAAESFQVITLFGSRQVGKTTTADHLFGDEFGFVTLDDFDELALAHSNPKAFFESHPWPLIIDEVQKEAGLLNEIKKIVDEQRRIWMRNGEQRRLMFVLTGSNQFELQEGISESLAGRTAVINMSGFTQMEKRGIEGSLFEVDFEMSLRKQREYPHYYKSSIAVFEDIFQGGMPDICTGESERNSYYKAYIDTYIEKDVRKLISASSELQFRRFIEILSLRTAQELVYSDISKDLGINVDTCKRWISILQTSGIICLLQPYMSNMSKRIIKAPKLYFMDTGLCAYLCKWPSAEMLKDGVMNGAFFETYVVSEVIKSFQNNGVDPGRYLYYYRDIDKKEVDILLVKDGALYPVEIKKGVSPTKPTKNFNVLEKYKMPIKRGMVIDNTDAVRAINDKTFCFPVSLLGV